MSCRLLSYRTNFTLPIYPKKRPCGVGTLEQKIIRYIKRHFGLYGRATLEALGIAHKCGPCNVHTAGKGTNNCEHYLYRKHAKYSKPEADPQFNVAAYWYEGIPPVELCSSQLLIQMESN